MAVVVAVIIVAAIIAAVVLLSMGAHKRKPKVRKAKPASDDGHVFILMEGE